jgi:hypothetical protein
LRTLKHTFSLIPSLKHAALQSTREAEWMTMAIEESASFLFSSELVLEVEPTEAGGWQEAETRNLAAESLNGRSL